MRDVDLKPPDGFEFCEFEEATKDNVPGFPKPCALGCTDDGATFFADSSATNVHWLRPVTGEYARGVKRVMDLCYQKSLGPGKGTAWLRDEFKKLRDELGLERPTRENTNHG